MVVGEREGAGQNTPPPRPMGLPRPEVQLEGSPIPTWRACLPIPSELGSSWARWPGDLGEQPSLPGM